MLTWAENCQDRIEASVEDTGVVVKIVADEVGSEPVIPSSFAKMLLRSWNPRCLP